jgi:hypothetical protein
VQECQKPIESGSRIRHSQGAAAMLPDLITSLNITLNFSEPFDSWQGGTHENFNGLFLQYIQKRDRRKWLALQAK